MKPLLIIGSSSFGQLMAALADECHREVAGFIDDFNHGETIVGRTVDLGEKLSTLSFDLVMAIGYKHLDFRLELFQRLRTQGFSFPSLIHPTARVSKHTHLGDGCLIMAQADIDAFSSVGDACVIWPNATVSHDSRIGSNTFISPAATLCGFVTVGKGCFIGANSTITDGSTLEDGTFVKASSRFHTKKWLS